MERNEMERKKKPNIYDIFYLIGAINVKLDDAIKAGERE